MVTLIATSARPDRRSRKVACKRLVQRLTTITQLTSRRYVAHGDERESRRGGTGRPKRRLGREGAPLGQRGGAPLFVSLAGDEMALLIEMVVDLGMN